MAFLTKILKTIAKLFVDGISDSIASLLDKSQSPKEPTEADTAIFYSINNCLKGLHGISFGNFLIKQVVAELRMELPNLTTFSTLSPIPGFMRWLDKIDISYLDMDSELVSQIKRDNWVDDSERVAMLHEPIMRACAQYLVEAKRNGRPLDPVARFHLGNGASLERLNWLGDTSENGFLQSAGIMVNYLYDLKKIKSNHQAYVNKGKIALSRYIRSLL